MLYFWRRSIIFMLCSLLFLLNGCSSNNAKQPLSSNNDQTTTTAISQTQPATSTSASLTPTVLPVETSCPPAGSARPAVMPSIQLGKHPDLFYMSRPGDRILIEKYDVTTGQTADLISIPAPNDYGDDLHPHSTYPSARLSNDGQWILFQGLADGKDALQMVRVDGAELQTLYCGSFENLLLSPDLHSLIFSQNNGDLMLLNMQSGVLQTELKASNSESYFYQPLKWRDNTSIYVTRQRIGVGSSVPFALRNRDGVYLLKDITKDASQQNTNVQMITDTEPYDFDIQQDQMVTCQCDNNMNNVQLGPVTGKLSTIYTANNEHLSYARFLTSSKLLYATQEIKPGQNQGEWTSQKVAFYTMDTHGSNVSLAASLPDNSQVLFHWLAYTPNDSFSSGMSMYAVELYNNDYSHSLVLGKLDGSAAKTIFTTSPASRSHYGAFSLIGWSTY